MKTAHEARQETDQVGNKAIQKELELALQIISTEIDNAIAQRRYSIRMLLHWRHINHIENVLVNKGYKCTQSIENDRRSSERGQLVIAW
jgi:hypothetical protein